MADNIPCKIPNYERSLFIRSIQENIIDRLDELSFKIEQLHYQRAIAPAEEEESINKQLRSIYNKIMKIQEVLFLTGDDEDDK